MIQIKMQLSTKNDTEFALLFFLNLSSHYLSDQQFYDSKHIRTSFGMLPPHYDTLTIIHV